MKVTTSRFGELNVADDRLLSFPAGLIGFSQFTTYVLLDDERGLGYQWLQCVEDGNLAFVLVEPGYLKPDYQIEIQDDALDELGWEEGDQLITFAIVRIPHGHPEDATANLRGPIVINLSKRKGKQIILNESYPLRFPLVPNEKKGTCSSSKNDRETVRT